LPGIFSHNSIENFWQRLESKRSIPNSWNIAF